MKRPHIVTMIQKVMHQDYPDVKVVLYGSEARGDARPDSDIDLLILLNKDKISFDDRMEIRRPLYDIELETGVQISSYFETQSTWNTRHTEFSDNVNREGMLL